jgi:hypothetical protein
MRLAGSQFNSISFASESNCQRIRNPGIHIHLGIQVHCLREAFQLLEGREGRGAAVVV